MSNLKYFLVIDNSTQWCAAAVAVKDNDKSIYSYDYLTEKYIDISNADRKGKIFDNIYSREMHFTNKCLDRIGGCGGWSISEREFKTIEKLVELKPVYLEYLRLQDNLVD